VAYLGGPRFRRQQLRLHDAPPGGFAPTPRKLREGEKLRQEEERRAERRARELTVVERFAAVILFLLAVAVAVLIAIMVALHT